MRIIHIFAILIILTMAYTKEGFLGNFKGRLGNLVVYQRNGQTVIRTLTANKMPPATGAKKQAQGNFSKVMKLMQALKPYVSRGFSDVAEGKSAFHTALSVNLKRLGEATSDEGLEWLLTSQGTRAGAQQLSAEIDNREATVRWGEPVAELPWSSNDGVMLLALNATTLETVTTSVAAIRRQQQASLTLPPTWDDQKVYLFITFYNTMASKKDPRNISDSQLI
jgi:hypothetical protein